MFVLNDVMNENDDMKFLLFQSMIILFTAYTVMCNSNTLLPMWSNITS